MQILLSIKKIQFYYANCRENLEANRFKDYMKLLYISITFRGSNEIFYTESENCFTLLFF